MALEVQIERRLPQLTLDVCFTAEDEPLSILGPSGAGKSMLLRCVAGLERASRGRIVLGSRTLLDTAKRIQIPARHRRLGMLFQHFALFPHRTVAENIAFGLPPLSLEERSRRVTALLARTRISGLEGRYPRQLSGGEQQRAALARALAIEPEALLLDEPLSALDTQLRNEMEAQLQETFAAYRRPALLVTHNIEEAYRLGRRMLVLSNGKVAAFGAKEEILHRPASVVVARITGCKNISKARVIAPGVIEALDWGCQLRVAQPVPRAGAAHVGIRAHEIGFEEAGDGTTPRENVFACWLVRSSETPFRMTLYLTLRQPLETASEEPQPELQAEVFKEKWERFRRRPQPWHVRLSPDSVFVMPD